MNLRASINEIVESYFHRPVKLDHDGRFAEGFWRELRARFASLGLDVRLRLDDEGLVLHGGDLAQPHVLERDHAWHGLRMRPIGVVVYAASEAIARSCPRVAGGEVVVDPDKCRGRESRIVYYALGG